MMRKNIWTISQLVGYIKMSFNNIALKNISIQGEIGNFTNHYSGHWYFTLKDKDALLTVRCLKDTINIVYLFQKMEIN